MATRATPSHALPATHDAEPWARLERSPLALPDPYADGVEVRQGVAYASPYGFRPLHLDLYTPTPTVGLLPIVVWIHGGAFAMGHRGMLPDFLRDGGFFAHVAEAGFAVAAIDYRLSGEALFPAQLHDVKAAVRWLRTRAAEFGADPGRIALWGESAGGHLASITGMTGRPAVVSAHPELEGAVGYTGCVSSVRAVVDWYGPTDFAAMDRQAPDDSKMAHDAPDSPESLLLGGPVQELPDAVRLANPCTYVGPGAPAFLIRHGTADRLVPFEQSVLLATALREAGASVDFEAVDGADHVFDNCPDRWSLVDEAISFIRRSC